ncbi:MAG: alpha-amylase family glycosyl hydrolase [Dysgonamonadaceae bacterium]|nr:alpha-amylase family glycosyl hydrolase [Dysgonamonadaceae bacterium]
MKKISILLFATLLFVACKTNNRAEPAKIVDGEHAGWVYDATIYEVNVRQYTPEGTFSAFEAHIPRLKELGVDILWFMPIQTIGEVERKGSLGSYYSIQNYTQVNEEFGTFEDFKSVVEKAHASGLKVILDWVANHTSRDAVWLQNDDWYVTDSLGNVVAPYDWSDVAKLNYENSTMRNAMLQDMLWWVREADIDGFRCDVAGEVPTDFWERVADSIKTIKSDIFMLAEAEKPELNDKAFDAFYAWDFHHKMNSVAQGKENVDSLRASLNRINDNFPPRAIPMYFTSNHDENSWSGTEFERMGDATYAFAALTYVLPGMPLIYNGQEIGFNRRLAFFEKDSIDWTAPNELSADKKHNLTSFYKSLNALRKSNPALFTQEKGGEMVEIVNNHPDKVWSFKRVKGENEVHCIFNFSDEEVVVEFKNEVSGKEFKEFMEGEPSFGMKSTALIPWGYMVFYN